MLVPALLLTAAIAGLPTAQPVPPGATLERASPTAQASLMVGLTLVDHAGLDALIAAQHDPKSPTFRRWLTPTEFGARFGLSQPAYDAAARALAKTGLEVTRYPSRLLLHATGTVSEVEQLLGVTLWDVRTASGQRFRTFQGKPTLPSALASKVQSLSGLDTRSRFKRRMALPQYDAFGPQDLRRFYDAIPLHQQGFAGQLSRVGVVGPIPDTADLPDPADLDYFYRSVADSPVTFELVNLGLQGSQPDNQGDKGELELDAEMSAVAAPLEQKITMVLGPSDTMFLQGMGYFANVDYTVTAVSTSYGSCEPDELYFYADEVYTLSDIVAQGSAEGISWFAASGDNGADDCGTGPILADGGGGDGPAVDYPGSLPYMVSVGGTTTQAPFDSHDAIAAWAAETPWNSGGNNGAGGGGLSIIFGQPSYQTGSGTQSIYREVPDFSLLADPQVGVVVDDFSPGSLEASGGTSDAAPMAAGAFALINDFIGGCRIGAPQFELYRLGASGTHAAVFHDITTGDLTQNGVTGPSSRVGFDDATGWGSLDLAQLAQAWPACAGSGTSTNTSGPLFDGGGYAGDAGSFNPGEYDGGVGVLDGGPRAAFDACAILACDGGAVCTTLTEGPSACTVACNPSGANTCPSGNYCSATTSTCVPGCNQSSDCASGQVCDPCMHTCAEVRDAGPIGDPCTDDTQCGTLEFCYPPDPSPGVNLPDGYCSAGCDPSTVACSCPPGSTCDGAFQLCFRSCSMASNGPCDDNQVCNDFNNGDSGVCLPSCRTDEDCNFGDFQDTCDTASGRCVAPSSTTTTSSSGSTGSSTTTTSSGSSTGSASSTGTSTTGTTGATTTSGAGTTTSAAASGSTGSTGSSGKSGCGCGASDASFEAPLGLLFAAFVLLRRRR
ncbi:MAG: hypothetical protein JST54_30890 [Deltaproteobacteria bacterium]|nr:hypothetical protein [Deltaproteobacteria bacterium]